MERYSKAEGCYTDITEVATQMSVVQPSPKIEVVDPDEDGTVTFPDPECAKRFKVFYARTIGGGRTLPDDWEPQANHLIVMRALRELGKPATAKQVAAYISWKQSEAKTPRSMEGVGAPKQDNRVVNPRRLWDAV